MLNNVLGWTAVLLIAPVLTFLHEIAHAAVGLLVGPERTWIELGSGERRRSFRLGRIDVHMHTPLWFFSGHMGYEGTRPSPRGEVAVSVAGPLSSLVMGLGLLVVHWNTKLPPGPFHLVFAGAQWALIQTLMTGIPMVYPAGMPGYAGKPSDGLRAVRCLADARAGRTEPTG